jgi:GNAT superfamily N-acetyltransferase
MTLELRQARRDDGPVVLAFIRRLAEYEKLAHEMDATEDGLAEALFGASPHVFCDLASWNRQPVGFALWFYSFSTFRGRHGIYLEDLFVEPDHRGRGIGKALIERLAGRCRAEGLPRLEWGVFDWNTPSIAFYRRIGAEPIADWTIYRLTGPALDRMAGA